MEWFLIGFGLLAIPFMLPLVQNHKGDSKAIIAAAIAAAIWYFVADEFAEKIIFSAVLLLGGVFLAKKLHITAPWRPAATALGTLGLVLIGVTLYQTPRGEGLKKTLNQVAGVEQAAEQVAVQDGKNSIIDQLPTTWLIQPCPEKLPSQLYAEKQFAKLENLLTDAQLLVLPANTTVQYDLPTLYVRSSNTSSERALEINYSYRGEWFNVSYEVEILAMDMFYFCSRDDNYIGKRLTLTWNAK